MEGLNQRRTFSHEVQNLCFDLRGNGNAFGHCGHAGNSMDDLYDMVKHNVAFRKQKAAEHGIGFELPTSVSIVPNVPKNTAKTKIKKAA